MIADQHCPLHKLYVDLNLSPQSTFQFWSLKIRTPLEGRNFSLNGTTGFFTSTSLQNVLRRTPFVAKRFEAAVKCAAPRCEICELAKSKRRPKKAEIKTKNPDRDGSLKADHLSPGLKVSVDYFECRQRGRTRDSYGNASSKQYVGGCIFVDRVSPKAHVEHEFGLYDVETFRSKQAYKRMCLDNDFVVKDYLTDSGSFKVQGQ
jgi:hypothetical protein